MIQLVKSKDWNKFFYSELMDEDWGKKPNYFQLFESKLNEHDNNLKYFCYPNDNGKYWYFFFKVKNLIVGQITIQQSPKEKDLVWLNSISVDPKYKNKGISKKLIKNVFNWAKKNNLRILSSYYETEGELYSKHVLRREAKNIGVVFFDKETILSDYVQW